ncbi:ATP synthase F0, B subunit [Bifidobacterium gallicum DSM 20093 = LMG 11596]|uniref:ATP synthase subunit b n=1 Tax=Bifidobacterium gallicum DSM 20093 = LMG 11596 TaxID=561180 RepID=D1NWQ4_9BIFI|nr:ATP synthase F0, B subunit [Bifidobacterium gallicum DSM 20093 = LMG 11596]KFI59052.1 F0F1 ATP synthase subunit B [Bifidobacterium gallicum DSM 20093 = LMG 11596]
MVTLAESGVDLFIPKVYDIVWSLIILIIVALFFYKFFLPKFQAVFDERAEKIKGGMAKAEQAQRDADEMKKEFEAKLAEARIDASKKRDNADAEAARIIAEARTRAATEAAQITENANRSIEAMKQKALVEVKAQINQDAVRLAAGILQRDLTDAAVQQDMIDKQIDGIATAGQGK